VGAAHDGDVDRAQRVPCLRHGHVAQAAFPHLDRGQHRGHSDRPALGGARGSARTPDAMHKAVIACQVVLAQSTVRDRSALATYACRLCPCQQPCRWIMRRAQNLRFRLTLSARCALIAANERVRLQPSRNDLLDGRVIGMARKLVIELRQPADA
jgi:hypothetical protein